MKIKPDHSIMYDITYIDEHTIFKASEYAQQMCAPMIESANASNEVYLETVSEEEPKMPISGAFIYAHAPNYVGRPTLSWNKSEWKTLFRQFQWFGIDTAIFQAAIWNELKECYYPSKAFGLYKSWNVIEPMLEAANEEKISIFLGGYGSTNGLSEYVSNKAFKQELGAYMNCLNELLQYRDLFDGFYFSPESAYTGAYQSEKVERLNRIYREFFQYIKGKDDSLRIMMSPGTKYFAGKEQEMEAHWLEMLAGVPLDILAPQDSIGTCGNRLDRADQMYRIWQSISNELKVHFWSNIEIFQRSDITQLNNSITATPERVTAQINAAAPYAEKLICWEAPYYLCDNNNPNSAPLSELFLSMAEATRSSAC